MSRYVITVSPAEGDGPVMSWHGEEDDDETALKTAEASYRSEHPEAAELHTRVMHVRRLPNYP